MQPWLASSRRLERPTRGLRKPLLKLANTYELPPATANPQKLVPDVLVEKIPTYAERSGGFIR